jgi:putative copper export protein
MSGLLAGVTPALDGVRLSLHILAASVWVGGQLSLAGLVPTLRKAGADVPRQAARAFARVSWPAYAVLLATGIWNVAAASSGQGSLWSTLLGVHIGLAVLAGVAAAVHSRAKDRRQIAIWGGVSGLAAIAALVVGVFLAG